MVHYCRGCNPHPAYPMVPITPEPSWAIELREAEAPVEEAATAKAAALGAARSIEDILASKEVDEETKTAARGFRAMLRKRWADLRGESKEPDDEPPTSPPPPTDDDPPPTPDPVPSDAKEAALDTFEAVPLTEAGAGRREFNVRIIRPGWGTSGYYSAAALEAAAKGRVFPAGLKMFWNHPTKSEERERPERDLRDLAGTLREDARWEANGPEGPGLYAPIAVTEPFAGSVRELAAHIGVSIRGSGKARTGEAEGRTGPIIEAITGAKSIDFVTAPGAGGKVVELFEAARQSTSEDDGMDLKEALAAKEAADARATAAEARIKELEEASRQSAEALLLREAHDHVAGKLAGRKLPEMTVARLVESVSAKASAKEGKLDIPALEAALDDAVKVETAYLEGVLGKGKVSGMGGGDISESKDDPEVAKAIDSRLDDAFSRLGLSEAERKVAVAGR